MVRRNALSLAVRAMGKLAPTSIRAGTRAPASIPPGQPAVSIPPGKLATPAEETFWDPKKRIFMGHSGSIHRLLLYTGSEDDTDEDDTREGEFCVDECHLTEDQQSTMIGNDGLVLTTLCNGLIHKHAHLAYRGVQGVRTPSGLFPVMPKQQDEEGHWPRLQVAVYPDGDRCWFTVLDGEGQEYWCDTSISFAIEFVTSCNLSHMQNYDDPSKGLFYEGAIAKELRDAMILRLKNSGCIFSEQRDFIGKGRQGKVFKSKRQLDGREAAMKKILPGSVEATELKSNGLLHGREAAVKKMIYTSGGEHLESHITKQLSYPSVRPLIASWRESENIIYLAFELCQRNIQEYGECGFEFSLSERLQMFLDALLAAEDSHDKGVCHRDINISNILLAKDGVAKLADFGHAAVIEGKLFPALDGKGMSSRFSAPELKLGKPHSSKVDGYSLAFVYYFLMSSRLDLRKALEEFVDVVCSADWAKDKEAAWENNNLSDDWHGNKELLFRMLDSNANCRASVKEIIPEIQKKIKLLRKRGQ